MPYFDLCDSERILYKRMSAIHSFYISDVEI